MTCIEKLRELHPEWSEYHVQRALDCDCPHEHMEVDTSDHRSTCCIECWNRLLDGAHIPQEFEYVGRTTGEKHYTKVVEKVRHHYTGETIYRTHIFLEDGGFDERYHREDEMLELLKMRVGG